MTKNRTTAGERSVRPETLDHQERGLILETRPAATEPEPDTAPGPGEELQAFRERLASAKTARPNPAHPHCLDCFRRGWAAAVDEIEGGD